MTQRDVHPREGFKKLTNAAQVQDNFKAMKQ